MLWRQVHGWNSLDAAGLGALKRLAQWRDRTAEERDLPRNYLLTDALLVDTARRRPDSMETLLANRRFPAQLGKRDGKALITLLEQSPPMAIPPSFRLQQDLLKIAACLNEASSGISAELLLPEPVLYAFMQTGELELWRQEGVGDDFFNFLSGKKLIAMPGYLREKEEKEKA
jgi:ribonuclease D